MGGKGIRRREKNYKAAHGGAAGASRLPPPPKSSSLDAVPNKLRQLFSLTRDGKPSSDTRESGQFKDGKSQRESRVSERAVGVEHKERGDKRDEITTDESKKKKRKRNKGEDLRFEALDAVAKLGSKRKERKKLRTAERKKKHKKPKTEEETDFPGHDIVKFGDVVQAPPKLVAFPKPSKNTHDPSQERLRLQAVEDYRKRKGWTSRLGVQLPSPVTALL